MGLDGDESQFFVEEVLSPAISLGSPGSGRQILCLLGEPTDSKCLSKLFAKIGSSIVYAIYWFRAATITAYREITCHIGCAEPTPLAGLQSTLPRMPSHLFMKKGKGAP